jgi:hypothetical protein
LAVLLFFHHQLASSYCNSEICGEGGGGKAKLST